MINFRNIFEEITRTSIKDFISKENSISVIVDKGNLGRVIGKNGMNIKMLERRFNKRIKIIEYDEDVKTFINNIITPIKLKEIELEGDNIKLVAPGTKERGLLIGRESKNLEELKKIVYKYFKIKNIKIT